MCPYVQHLRHKSFWIDSLNERMNPQSDIRLLIRFDWWGKTIIFCPLYYRVTFYSLRTSSLLRWLFRFKKQYLKKNYIKCVNEWFYHLIATVWILAAFYLLFNLSFVLHFNRKNYQSGNWLTEAKCSDFSATVKLF